MNIIEQLTKSIRSASKFNPEVQVAPACILWPDRDRQWEAVIQRLQGELPELLTLGDYKPEHLTGPAIWLRCIIAGETSDISLPEEHLPILYLPGVSRQDLRAVESCPDHLKPLAELQYRGVIWSQVNAKDWTILAYLGSNQGGLGLDVAQDSDAKSAMQLALYRLLDEEVELLKGKRLDKDYFNTLLTGGDPVRDLLQWLDQGDAFQANRGENEWKAFVEVCKSQLAFNPQNKGVLAGAAKLAAQEGPWHAVWERFREAPKRYPNIPEQIQKCTPPEFDLFADEKTTEGWPQWNVEREKASRRDLLALSKVPAHQARNKILELENQHGSRRHLVWAELGEAPLACALEHLAILADITKTSLAAGQVEDLAGVYSSHGWKADDAVVRSLAIAGTTADFEVISTAIRSIYLPWAEETGRHLQKIVDGKSYPGGTHLTAASHSNNSGECILFVDGLRFDTGKRLSNMLELSGHTVTEEPIWTALPSVTATGKAAVTPVRDKIRGNDTSTDFEPAVAETGQSLKGGYHLKKLLTEAGWAILDHADNGDGQGNAWCEFGDIDHEGHNRGWKLAKHIDVLLTEIHDRITSLITAGWKNVRVVTDHGWLLLPGGLPKVDLPSALAETKWGRCASLKSGATSEDRLYPWYWNPNKHFALADGISCFKKGEEYTHGGLSPQECLTLQLTVTSSKTTASTISIEITDLVWKGLRCTVAIDSDPLGLSLDIRTEAGDPLSSVVVGIKAFKDNGTSSVVVENEDLEGEKATLVLIDSAGELVAQVATNIGGVTE
jgi:hypothetical protein